MSNLNIKPIKTYYAELQGYDNIRAKHEGAGRTTPEYDKLKFVQNPDVPLDWRVEKMKFSKDKTSLIYNDFLTLAGVPEKAFDYRFGACSAVPRGI